MAERQGIWTEKKEVKKNDRSIRVKADSNEEIGIRLYMSAGQKKDQKKWKILS